MMVELVVVMVAWNDSLRVIKPVNDGMASANRTANSQTTSKSRFVADSALIGLLIRLSGCFLSSIQQKDQSNELKQVSSPLIKPKCSFATSTILSCIVITLYQFRQMKLNKVFTSQAEGNRWIRKYLWHIMIILLHHGTFPGWSILMLQSGMSFSLLGATFKFW